MNHQSHSGAWKEPPSNNGIDTFTKSGFAEKEEVKTR